MQAHLVKRTPQANVWDNSVQSSTSYQIQQSNWEKFSSCYQKQWGGKCAVQEFEAGKGHLYLTKGWKKHRWRSLFMGSFQCLGQFSSDSVVGLHGSFHRAPTEKSRLCPWPSLKIINLIYQVFTEIAFFFFFLWI